MPALHSPLSAKETRARARENLKGRWPLAVLITFLAGVMGGQSGLPTISFDITSLIPEDLSPFFDGAGITDMETLMALMGEMLPAIVTAVVTALAFFTVLFIIGPCIHWGLCRFRLSLIDGDKPTVGVLFSGFKSVFLKALGIQVLQTLILLAVALAAVAVSAIPFALLVPADLPWLALPWLIAVAGGVIGGAVMILLTCRYSMSYYALVDNPELRAVDALRESAHMMKGNKRKLICLWLSFIGWALLCSLTGGIGTLFYAPYVGQAEAVFYHHVSGRAAIREAVEELSFITEGL